MCFEKLYGKGYEKLDSLINYANENHTINLPVRLIGLALCSFNLYYCIFVMHDPTSLFIFFTNWALLLQFTLQLASIKCAFTPTSPFTTAVSHYLFGLCALSHSVVLLVYWPFLHARAVVNLKGTPLELYIYTVHTMPQLAFFMNYWVTKVNFVPTHAPYLGLPVGIAYGVVNWYVTVMVFDGNNPYYFIGNWREIKSPMMVCALTGGFMFLYYVFASLVLRRVEIKTECCKNE